MGLGKMHQYVFCHLCPTQELCPYAQVDISEKRFKWLQTDSYDNKTTSIAEDEKLKVATNNCPLRQEIGL